MNAHRSACGQKSLLDAASFYTLTAVQERSEFDEPDYALIDTLFSLAEAHLFMQARTGEE